VRWFPFCGLTEHHEFHHAINMGCFASKLNIYDKLFNSESKYLAWRSKRTQAGAKEE
jgi:sterol desaturase/sphingolipid hydroxylase (fatty acid hydroxylase superfamily)